MITLRIWRISSSTSSCDETVSIVDEWDFSRKVSGRVSHLASVMDMVAREGLFVFSSLRISLECRPWKWLSSMSSSISSLPVSTPLSMIRCHFLSGVAVHSMLSVPVIAVAIMLPNGSKSVAL